MPTSRSARSPINPVSGELCGMHPIKPYDIKEDKKMANQINGNETKDKPLGIILLAIYFAVVMGLFALITSIPLVFMSGLESSGLVALIGIALLTIGVLSFAACYGLWILIDWGRSLAIVISAIDIPLSLIALKIPGAQATSGSILLLVVGIALDAAIIWYLCKDDVKSLFSKDPVPISTDKSTDKFCTECGAKNSKDSGFCSECGVKIK